MRVLGIDPGSETTGWASSKAMAATIGWSNAVRFDHTPGKDFQPGC